MAEHDYRVPCVWRRAGIAVWHMPEHLPFAVHVGETADRGDDPRTERHALHFSDAQPGHLFSGNRRSVRARHEYFDRLPGGGARCGRLQSIVGTGLHFANGQTTRNDDGNMEFK